MALLRSILESLRKYNTVSDKDAPVTAAVSAGGRILELMLKATEIADLSARLDRLEASMGDDR
jgi:hypothetical protein